MPFIFKINLIIIILLISTSCTNYFLAPANRIHYNDPKNEFSLDYEDIYFASIDKLKLHAQYIKAEGERKGLIVYFHGNGENLSSHFTNLMWIPSLGYDYIIIDWRGYGRSWGNTDIEGSVEDTLVALNLSYALKKKKSYKKFIVYGQSMGGAIVLKALSKFKDIKDVDLLVLDSTFIDYKGVAFDVLKRHAVTFLFSPLAYLLVSNDFSPKNEIKTYKMPTLVIHAKNDKIVNFGHGEEIYSNLTMSQKWFWQLPEGNHIDVFRREKGIYKKKFISLLETL